MEEKLVKVLLAQYKEKGVDMYALLDDQFFMKLNLDQKVDLIKKNAAEISAGTNRALTKKDIRNLVLDAGFAGLGSGFTAMMAAKAAHGYFHGGKGLMPTGLVAGAAALGAATAAGTAYVSSIKRINERKDILKKIDETAKNPSDENALRVLTTRNHQFNPPSTGTFSNNTARTLTDAAHDAPKMLLAQVPAYVAHRSLDHNYRNNENEFAEGHSADTLHEALRQSFDNRLQSMNDTTEKMLKNLFGHN